MSTEIEMIVIDRGVAFPVRVVPRASRNALDGVHDGSLRVRLKAPPVDGAANKALCTFLAKMLGVPKRQVEIRSGGQSRNKTVTVIGVCASEVRRTLIARSE